MWPRRAPLHNQNLNLFDLILEQTLAWEELREEDKMLAVEILARLIAKFLSKPHEEMIND
jgi:hypothetical protein